MVGRWQDRADICHHIYHPLSHLPHQGAHRPTDVIGWQRPLLYECLSVYRHHGIAHFGENEIRGVPFDEGPVGLVINLLLQITDGFVGCNKNG